MRPALTLHRRLFISHVLVVVLGLLSFALVRRLSFLYLFSRHLDSLELNGLLRTSAREVVVEGYNQAWNYSSVLATLVGAIASAALSYWVATRINQALVNIERSAYRLATGHLQERVPASPIPELARLSRSINQMVTALEDGELRRRDLITDLSHELRTPLTVIRGYLEEIDSDRLKATPEIRSRLITETRRLERLVNNLQELSKAESGSLPLTLKSVALKPLLVELCDRFSSQLLEDGPELALDCPNNIPNVWADSDRLEQILINLLGNAIRHTQCGRITLSAKASTCPQRTEHDCVQIAVQDTGSGIASDDLAHVFDRFWRSADARAQQSGGTGIGLTITRQLIELQGGQITVESQLHQGTTFTFWLPANPQPR